MARAARISAAMGATGNHPRNRVMMPPGTIPFWLWFDVFQPATIIVLILVGAVGGWMARGFVRKHR